MIWVLLGLVALAVLITYARLPSRELYNVSQEGLRGGVGRMLVFLCFPASLVAIGILGALLERGAPKGLAWTAIVLCAVTALPDVVDPDDLDAKAVNVLPALGVLLALGLTLAQRPTAELAPRRALDPLRVAVAIAVVAVSVPWFFAELGFYAPDPFLADEVPVGEALAAVHLGHHHGIDGMLLTLSALLLSRVARSWGLRAWVALMFVYGVGNLVQDAWLEQLVKRGTTGVEIPSLLVPEPSRAWVVMLAAAAVLFVASLRRPQPPPLRSVHSGRSEHGDRAAEAGHPGWYLLTMNSAPWGSRSVATRTTPRSTTGATTVAPSPVARSTTASASSTANVTLQNGPTSSAVPASCMSTSQATASAKLSGVPSSAWRLRRSGSRCSRKSP